VDGHKWLRQIGKMLEKIRRCNHVRLTKEGDNKRKHKYCDMNKYCDTSEKLARLRRNLSYPMQITILNNRHEGDKLNYQYDVTI
jgi:hypothetical protein